MKEISYLMNSFSKKEKELFRQYLELFSRYEKNKLLDYYDIISKNPEIDSNDFCLKLYKKPDKKSFANLSARFKDRLVDFSYSIRPEWSDFLKDDVEKQQFQFMKLQMTGFLFNKQGELDLARDYYYKAMDIADFMEDNIYKIIICHHLNGFYTKRRTQDTEGFRNYVSSLKKISTNLDIEVESIVQYIESCAFIDRELDYVKKANEVLAKEEEILTRFCQYPEAPRAEMYAHWMFLNYKKALMDHVGILNTIQNIISLFQKYPGLNHQRRMKIIITGAMTSYILLCKLEFGKRIGKVLLQHYPTNSNDFVIVSIHYISAKFFSEDPYATIEHLNQLSTNPYLKHVKKYSEMVDVFNAIFCFILGKPVDFQYFFKEVSMIIEDKNAFYIDMRIMEIIDLLNKELYDVAESKIESLRKHLERYPESLPHYHDYYKIFQKMVYHSFDYTKLFHTECLERVNRIDLFCAMSSDLVNPRIWLLAKQENVSYYQMLVREFQEIEKMNAHVPEIDFVSLLENPS